MFLTGLKKALLIDANASLTLSRKIYFPNFLLPKCLVSELLPSPKTNSLKGLKDILYNK